MTGETAFHGEMASAPNGMRIASPGDRERSVIEADCNVSDERLCELSSGYILGRYMLTSRGEYPCHVAELSPDDMKLIAPVCGKEGEHVIAYVDHIGRLEGNIVRAWHNGFAMSIQASTRKRDKLATRLGRLQNQMDLQLSEGQEYSRFIPKIRSALLGVTSDVARSVEIIDLSLAGARIATPFRPKIGSRAKLGKVACRVVQHLDEGISVEFTALQHPGSIESDVIA